MSDHAMAAPVHRHQGDLAVGRNARARIAAALFGALAIAMAAMPLRGQGWSALPPGGAPPPAPRRVVDAPDGTRLALDGDCVLRTRGATTVALARTGPSGTSAAAPRELVPAPGGVVYVVAGDQLFATHADVDTFDRVEFAEGGPRGPIVGVVADRIDRLWVATTTQLFAVHTGQWFHRRHGTADGLPAPPYRALAPAPDGGLLLHTEGGMFVYRPDPAAPQLLAARVASVGPGTIARLDLRAEAAGGVAFRWREASHHRLQPADGALDLRRPGRHAILVYAVDRDLDLSAPRALSIDAPFAARWDARHAALAAVLLGLALGAWRFGRAVRAGRGRGRPWLDGAIALVLVLQLGMAMTGIGRTYPFIGFTMYGEVWRENDVLFTPAVVVHGPDGATRDHCGRLSFATDGVWRHLASTLFADASAQRAFVAGLGPNVDAVELRIDRCRLTAEGPRRVAPWVLAQLPRGAR